MYGKHWKLVEKHVGTRSGTQVRSHAQKYYMKINSEKLKEKSIEEPGMTNRNIEHKDSGAPIFLPSESEYQHRENNEVDISKAQKQEKVYAKKISTLVSGEEEKKSDIGKEVIKMGEKTSLVDMQTKVEEQRMVQERSREQVIPKIKVSTNDLCCEDNPKTNRSKVSLEDISGQSFASILSRIENHNSPEELKESERILFEMRHSTNILMLQVESAKKMLNDVPNLDLLEEKCVEIINMLGDEIMHILLGIIQSNKNM